MSIPDLFDSFLFIFYRFSIFDLSSTFELFLPDTYFIYFWLGFFTTRLASVSVIQCSLYFITDFLYSKELNDYCWLNWTFDVFWVEIPSDSFLSFSYFYTRYLYDWSFSWIMFVKFNSDCFNPKIIYESWVFILRRAPIVYSFCLKFSFSLSFYYSSLDWIFFSKSFLWEIKN